MPTAEKVKIVKTLIEKIAKAKGVVFTDYKGLSHLQIQKLRSALFETGAEYQVVKNTLVKIALTKSSYPTTEIEGPTAILFIYQEEIAPLKALAMFAKGTSLPTFKGGFLGKKFFEASRLEELAKIPSIDYLRGFLIGNLNLPIQSLTGALKGNLSQLVFTLGEIYKKKPAQS